MAGEAGLVVGVRSSSATPARLAGLLLFIAGLTVTADGRIEAATP